jgi:proline iminopeptidase
VNGVVDDRPTFELANLLELADGRLVEWEAFGTGEPLLWIEGGPGLPAHLGRPDVELLADRFRGHLVNAPGCGRSSPPADYGLDAHVRYFDDVRRALGLGKVTVMGHSWGGLVALAFALALPEAVERLIVTDGYAGESTVSEAEATAQRERAFDRIRAHPWFEAAAAVFEEDLDTTARQLDERFEQCWPLYFAEPDSQRSRRHIERLQRETRWNIDAVRAWTPEPAVNLLPQLQSLRVPTLIIVGEHDFICGPAWNRPIADAIPDVVYAEIPGGRPLPPVRGPRGIPSRGAGVRFAISLNRAGQPFGDVGAQKRSLPLRSSSRTPPFLSMTVREPTLSTSHVMRAGSIPSSLATRSAWRSISVAWPRRRADGRTSYPMWPPISRSIGVRRWRIPIRPRNSSPSTHHSSVSGT